MTAENGSKDPIAAVLGRTPSGVFILSAGDGEGLETGMLASWVQQASFDPPMISVAVNSKRYLNAWLHKVPRVALSILGESQPQFVKHFGKGFEPGEAAFEGLSVARGANGLPVLVDALGYLEGDIETVSQAGDHSIYFIRITGAGSTDRLNSEKPMVHIRKNGLRY